MVGHGRENIRTTSKSGQGRGKSVGCKQGDVHRGHGVAIGQANGVTEGDRTLADAMIVGVNEEVL